MPPQDPGAYFYNKGAVYGVDKVTGTVTWWVDLPAAAIAAYHLSNGAVGEDRYSIYLLC